MANAAESGVAVHEFVVDRLRESGIENFAGMVGSTTAPYVARLGQDDGARYIPVRHEQTAAAVMDATARLTGKPGCLLTHGASGALAASLGVASAARDFSPMVWVSATQERRAMEQQWWQTLSVVRPTEQYAKWQTRVERPENVPSAVDSAIRAAVSGRPGVAQIDIPIDVATGIIPRAALPQSPAEQAATPLFRIPAPVTDVEATARLLGRAQRPVLVVGLGVRFAGAQNSLLRVAEALRIPVICSANARGVFDERHPLALGPSGILGFEATGTTLSQADVVVAVGCRISDMQTARGDLLPAGARIVHVDIDPQDLRRRGDLDLAIVADAGAYLDQLASHVAGSAEVLSAERAKWAEEAARSTRAWRDAWLEETSIGAMVQPQEVVRGLDGLLGDDAIMTHGAGDHGFYGTLLPVADPGAHLMSVKLGAMGCGLGFAMGARLVSPAERHVVACLGDGEFMLQIGDLETMVREQLPAVVVVFNNFRFGSQRKRVEAFGPAYGTDHTNPDFAALARLFGAQGFRVDAPGQFADAMRDALVSGLPTVIDVIIDPEARPRRIAVSQEAR